MKPKNFNKKLMLNKKTVAHLDNNEMNKAHGGVHPSAIGGCPTYGRGSCPTECYTVEYNPNSAPCCAGWLCPI
ncbi:MAG: class I lanthipeptide [Acidobacteria bacterium]|jgi:hypothetical protein|nr:class I lanthipeptide [Acidobacteriota bacterium]